MMKSGIDLNNRIKYEKYYSITDRDEWMKISMIPGLTEDFISVFRDKVHWSSICIYQYLSEKFIYEFKDYINPIYIIAYQEAHISKKCMDWLHELNWKKC